MQVADIVDQRLGGITDVMTAHHSVRRVYLQMTAGDRRYQGNDLRKPDAGTDAFQQGDIPFGNVPIKAIRTHPLAMMFGLDTGAIRIRALRIGKRKVGRRGWLRARACRLGLQRSRCVERPVPEAVSEPRA